MSTTGHETEAINVRGLKASLKKGGNIGIFNECICSTAGGTAAKVTNTVPPSFSLVSGAKIIVKFTYAITVANATLQVGETAAKPIRIMGAALDANIIKAGTSVLLSYDGTAYNIIGGVGGNDVDVNYDTTNKKVTKTINGVTSDVVTAETIVTDGGAAIEPEVEIGETAPTGTPKLFVDEDADPAVSIDVYTRAQVDAKIADTVHLSSQTLTSEQKAQVLSNVGLESKQAASGGTDLSLVTTGEKYNWNAKYALPSGGTSSQFLKADGSTDNTGYLPLSGGKMTGGLVVGGYYMDATANANISIISKTITNPRLAIGSAVATQKMGYIAFNMETADTASDNNHFSFNIHGLDDIMDIYANGKIRMGFTNTLPNDAPWYPVEVKGNLHVVGSTTSDKWMSDRGQFIGSASNTNYRIGIGATTDGYGVIQGGNSGVGAINLLLNPQHANDSYWYVGVGLSSPSYPLHVGGAVGATGYNNTSDIRKKDIIENINIDVEDIANAPIFKFSWIDPEMPEGINIGTSAQYWQTIIPEIVSEANDDEKTLSMQYGVASLASSIALARKVVEQENTIKAQEARIKALEDAIAEIQNKLK